ncbi:MAG: DNA/RNA non-specific endonuclease [Erysipelotrichaceae bacterium]|nr:DNA/RNA non-specific endonuclease [Erysipelotrichaceae bacterium]
MKNNWKRISNLFLFLCLITTMIGCGADSSSSLASSLVNSQEIVEQSTTSNSISEEQSAQSSTSAIQSQEDQQPNPAKLPITLADIPEYSGQPYVEINGNVPYFEENEKTTTAFQHYFELDELGRVTMAYGSLGQEILPEEERGDISSIHPTGWVQNRYECIKDGQALYNRCHLIAFSLSGQNANPKNLMTGTRYMNVKGMQPFESRTLDFIRKTNKHVMYQVTPLFEGDNLVANGVLMQAKSVEDDGQGLSFNVFCYNVQPGICINYRTGENWLEQGQAETSQTNNPQSDQQAQDYVLNTRSHKFHDPSCDSVDDMSQRNRKDVHETRDDLIAQGYTPCQRCNP